MFLELREEVHRIHLEHVEDQDRFMQLILYACSIHRLDGQQELISLLRLRLQRFQ